MVNNKSQLLYSIFENGNYIDSIKLLTGRYNENYTRQNARELISSYLNKHISSKENIHPIFQLDLRQVRELCEMLEIEIGGGKIKIENDPPSVW